MKAGWTEIDITPPLGTALGGAPDRDHGYEVTYDPVLAQVLALEDERGARLLFITADLTGILWRYRQRLACLLAERFGLRSEQFVFNTSHSHSAPAAHIDLESDPPRDLYAFRQGIAEYVPWLLEALGDAVVQALQAMRPARLFFGIGESNIAISRRLVVDGKAQFAPSPDGFYDRDLALIAVGESAQQPSVVLFIHGCHPTTRYGGEHRYALSADYPGAARRAIKDVLGQPVLAMFAQGAGADIRPPCIGEDGKFRAGTHEDVERMGRQLAQDVLSVMQVGLDEIAVPRFAGALEWTGLPLQKPLSPRELERLREDSSLPAYRRLWAERILLYLARGECVPAYVPMAVQVLRLDSEHLVVALAQEVVSELGAMVRAALAPARAALMAYSNETQVYIPTNQMLQEGGYEAEGYIWHMYPAPLAGCIDEVLVAKALEVAGRTSVE